GHPNIVLRTKISNIEDFRENLRKMITATIQQRNAPRENDMVSRMVSVGLAAFRDFERHGKLETLEHAISKFEAAIEMNRDKGKTLTKVDWGHGQPERWSEERREWLGPSLADPDTLPRIWWCATGPLAFLPIHAAGVYDDQSVGSHTCDYVISSYTPTLSSLLQSTEPVTDSQFKLLSVIQPSAPGVSSIPNTKEELECIKKRLGDRDHIILNDQEGTKERVMKAMMDSNWLHCACHGSQRQDEPTKSGLILEDGHLTLEEIIKLDLPNAEFAFLSACQTTTGEESLSDEAVHIAGGMLLAGYRGVVATMWSIQDDLAPEVADEFYRYIMTDQVLIAREDTPVNEDSCRNFSKVDLLLEINSPFSMISSVINAPTDLNSYHSKLLKLSPKCGTDILEINLSRAGDLLLLKEGALRAYIPSLEGRAWWQRIALCRAPGQSPYPPQQQEAQPGFFNTPQGAPPYGGSGYPGSNASSHNATPGYPGASASNASSGTYSWNPRMGPPPSGPPPTNHYNQYTPPFTHAAPSHYSNMPPPSVNGYQGAPGGNWVGDQSGGAFYSAPMGAPRQFSQYDQWGHGQQYQYSQCTGRKKALCIGINYAGTDAALRGCINDAKNMKQFLIKDIVMLLDDATHPRQIPTRANIVRESQTLGDLDGDEDDGYDEVIYPVDHETAGHLVDDDMHDIM
ncbi:16081_t:CDS:2, partial [Acaulospora colombiana]